MTKYSFSASITKFFLDRSRLTLLSLALLIIFGIGSLFTLRTTGFPSPTINVAIISTVYPGASSKTILENITKPLESAVKSVEGVKTFSSDSRDNVSIISATLNEKYDADAVKNKLDSAIKAVKLPDSAQAPQLFSPQVSGDEYYFALAPKNTSFKPAELYQVFQVFKEELEKDPAVNEVNVQSPIDKKVIIRINNQKMAAAGLSYDNIVTQLQTWGLSLPTAESTEVSDKESNILLTLSGSSLEDLSNLQFVSTLGPTPIVTRLSDIAQVEKSYELSEGEASIIGYRDQGKTKTIEGLAFSLDVSDEADLNDYDKKLKKLIEKYFTPNTVEFQTLTPQNQLIFKQYRLISVLSTAESNQEQVKEVVSGMVGGKWDIPGGWIGVIFGGIQLVFFAMLFMVSWRAALISALAIPLSFAFSLIWVKVTGSDLNTLVLFSLVLVIGLVVDPALVVLEAIQRKIENGVKGKKAVLEAIDEVGLGVLLAVLTSVIVFVPFGVVSGVFGAIISYIPLTVLPALIGSYVVPLVFLAWAGGFFLKRSSQASDEEEANLWPISRGLIKVNRKILHSHPALQTLIIVFFLVLPIALAGFYISSGQVKMVQFAQPSDGEEALVSVDKYLQKTKAKDVADTKELVDTIMQNGQVEFTAPYQTSNSSLIYLIKFTARSERQGTTAQEIVDQINNNFDNIKDRFFDISASVLGAGPQNSSYPISLAIKTNNLTTQKEVALNLTEILKSVCKKTKGNVTIDESCSDGDKLIEKVDNGYEERSTTFVEILLDRTKVSENQLNPMQVYGVVSSLYKINNNEKVATLKAEDEDLPVYLESDATHPKSITEIQDLRIPNLAGNFIRLGDISQIKEVESVPSIRRVKGEIVGVVNAKTIEGYEDQTNVSQIVQAVLDNYESDYASNYPTDVIVETYSEGDLASISKSFSELGIALLLAVILTYVVLVVFFNSFTQPLVILFAVPLTFVGIFPALAYIAGGQLGFLEIIGIIILVGIVENVAIFLIDAANQKVASGSSPKEAIAFASGVRFRPIMLTKVTTLVSTIPLIIFSEMYRSLSVVVVFGLLSSGFASLIITPILYIFFKSLGEKIKAIKF